MQISTISQYQRKVPLGGISFGAKNLCRNVISEDLLVLDVVVDAPLFCLLLVFLLEKPRRNKISELLLVVLLVVLALAINEEVLEATERRARKQRQVDANIVSVILILFCV